MNSKLQWLCRRGMKELDILMETYLREDYPTATPERQKAFAALLEYQDPLILDLLFERENDADPDIQALVEVLRDYNDINQTHASRS